MAELSPAQTHRPCTPLGLKYNKRSKTGQKAFVLGLAQVQSHSTYIADVATGLEKHQEAICVLHLAFPPSSLLMQRCGEVPDNILLQYPFCETLACLVYA